VLRLSKAEAAKSATRVHVINRAFLESATTFVMRSDLPRLCVYWSTEMRKSNFALRIQPSLLDEARKVAESDGVALNQFVNVAVAEKLSALRTASYFRERRLAPTLRKR